jgi:hypothetical protein
MYVAVEGIMVLMDGPSNHCGMNFGFLLIMYLLPVAFLTLFPLLMWSLDVKQLPQKL